MIFFSPSCLEYSSPGHPESPERVQKTYQYLSKRGYRCTEPEPCTEEDILLIHTPEHLERVKKGNFFDPDTPNLENMYPYCLLSAGGALQAAEEALEEGRNSFSLLRPPGHHAGRGYLGGFCYFNNMAIAVAWVLEKEAHKVAIVDFDGHHGNGTEDIFFREKRVLYLSLHQYPAYPGTGAKSRGNALNFPLPPGCGEKTFMESFRAGWERIEAFRPSLIAVSAGFDSHREETLLTLNLKTETYFSIGQTIASLGKPTFTILEGGYHRDLPFCVEAFLRGAEIT